MVNRLHTINPATGRQPLRIAHAAGNHTDRLASALAAGVDFIEADLWLWRDRLEIRHERRLGHSPILFDKGRIRLQLGQRMLLEDLLIHVRGRTGLLLDIKGGPLEAAERVVATLNEYAVSDRVILASRNWGILDRVRNRLDPHVALCHSVGEPAELSALMRLIVSLDIPEFIAIRHTQLSPQLVSTFKESGIVILAWTVDDLARAETLVHWGVDGIISNSLHVLHHISNSSNSIS